MSEILDLRDRPHYLPTLAQWHHAEWEHINPGLTLQQRIEKMAFYLHADFVPSTFVWEDDDAVLGSAAIIDSDMDTHPEWMPWLASVFVQQDRRGEGIGTALVRHAMDAARSQGIPSLYLFTPDQVGFYQVLGWKPILQEQYRGERVTIMKVELSEQR